MKNFFIFSLTLTLSFFIFIGQTHAGCSCTGGCKGYVEKCSEQCGEHSEKQKPDTKQHFTDEKDNHQLWMVDAFFKDSKEGDKIGLLAAMMLMAEQLTTNALQQVEIIGTFFDAKHQLETQRLFQTLTAKAHKDYHPSEEVCIVGTVARSLIASERKTNLVSTALSKRSIDRQLLSKETLEMQSGGATDKKSRLSQFIKRYCNPNDNSLNLNLLCKKGGAGAGEKNKDISYTSTIDLPLTLNIDMSDSSLTGDEEAVFALTTNLIAHQAMPNVPANILVTKDDKPVYEAAAMAYLDSRALVAKRSVAANSIVSITSMKASGDPESQPWIYALIKELSPDKFTVQDIVNYIGLNPSYYAQMEILTKKLYQSPKFYSDLYDKPANVLRKDVAIQAAELMQKRDIYRSLLRSEATLAVMLETALLKEQEKITNELKKGQEGDSNKTDKLGD